MFPPPPCTILHGCRIEVIGWIMRIEVWLRGYLWQYAPDKTQKPFVVEIGEGASIRELLEGRLSIPYWATKDHYLNGTMVDKDSILHDGDNLRVYPMIFVGG